MKETKILSVRQCCCMALGLCATELHEHLHCVFHSKNFSSRFKSFKRCILFISLIRNLSHILFKGNYNKHVSDYLIHEVYPNIDCLSYYKKN